MCECGAEKKEKKSPHFYDCQESEEIKHNSFVGIYIKYSSSLPPKIWGNCFTYES